MKRSPSVRASIFATVHHAKPPASRAESAEVYVVAMRRKATE